MAPIEKDQDPLFREHLLQLVARVKVEPGFMTLPESGQTAVRQGKAWVVMDKMPGGGMLFSDGDNPVRNESIVKTYLAAEHLRITNG